MPFSCEQCRSAPSALRRKIQRERGCTKPAKAAVWASDSNVYYSCPVKFAHPFLYEWLEQYRFGLKFHGLQYDRLPAKWFEAWHHYEACETRMQSKPNKPNIGGLAALKGAIHG